MAAPLGTISPPFDPGGFLRRTTALALILAGAAAPTSPGRAADAAPALSAEIRETAESLRENAFSGTRASEWIRSLIDRSGPRLSGSPGERASIAWGLETLKSLGFANVRAEKVRVPFWERGVETGEVTAPYPHKLYLTALGGSVATPPAGLEGESLERRSL